MLSVSILSALILNVVMLNVVGLPVKPLQPSVMLHSNLLGPFVCYEA
jgi:hypothetical protein